MRASGGRIADIRFMYRESAALKHYVCHNRPGSDMSKRENLIKDFVSLMILRKNFVRYLGENVGKFCPE